MKILNNQKVFGRKKEISLIENAIKSNKPELFAMYGKRRVGKSFLLNNTILDYQEKNEDCVVLRLIGSINTTNKIKLKRSFYEIESFIVDLINRSNKNIQNINSRFDYGLGLSLKNFLEGGIKNKEDWIDFFKIIEDLAFIFNERKIKFIVFIDEIPWLADKKGDFLSSFSLSWNQKLCYLNNVKFFISGSATNWIIKKFLKGKGGLHRRLTQSCQLLPFNFDEHKEYLLYKNSGISEYNIFLHYLVFGGVPYYLSLYDYNESLEKNIITLFNGVLKDEFEEIMSSLFLEKSCHKDILIYLTNNKNYHSKKDIVKRFSNKSQQTVLNNLEELVYCGFVKETSFFENKSHNSLYKINDNFIFFYLKNIYLKNIKSNNIKNIFDINSQSFLIWSGYAFELFLSNQIEMIKERLGISGVKTIDYCWNNLNDKDNLLDSKHSQIDLIIEREDNIIHIIECKFYNQEFIINDEYRNVLLNKVENFKRFLDQKAFKRKIKNKKDCNLVIISLYGSKYVSKKYNLNYKDLKLIN